jgi:hypothetical protein
MTYARKTTVAPEKTRGHIERELKRYGSTSFEVRARRAEQRI